MSKFGNSEQIINETMSRKLTFVKDQKKPKISLTARDEKILLGLHRYRFLDTNLIKEYADFASLQTAQRRLRLLFDADYVDRPDAQILDWLPHQGTKPTVYALGNMGVKFLKDNHRFSFPVGYQKEKNRRLKDVRFIRHTLGVASFMVAMENACVDTSYTPIFFDEILASLPEKVRNRPNPTSIPVTLRHNDQRQDMSVIPDAIFALQDSKRPQGKNRAYFFLEIDNSTEPLSRNSLKTSSILRKYLSYEAIWKQQLHTKYFGIKSFRVLFITTTKKRLESMIETYQALDCELNDQMFLFATFGELESSPFFDIAGIN